MIAAGRKHLWVSKVRVPDAEEGIKIKGMVMENATISFISQILCIEMSQARTQLEE